MDEGHNPYLAPQTTASLPQVDQGGGLRSLGQEVRKSSLNKARWIMIVIGILSIGANVYGLVSVQDEIRALERKGMVVDPGQLRLVYGSLYGFIAVGVAFIVMGIFIYQYPVPFTIAALVLYVGGQIISSVFFDPTLIARGWLFKILIIAGLWQAIQAARAYEEERRYSA